MTRMLRLAFVSTLFVFTFGSPVFAQTPKVLKLSEIQFGAKAIGFSVFRGVEPEKFGVQLRGIRNAEGFPMILSSIYEGPMETPLEKIGAVMGMSGSPVFVGDCVELDECVRKAVLPDNDVFLVGALSHAAGYFIIDGTNVLLTPAEYMLGVYSGGYMVASQFSARSPNEIIVDGREFKNLMLFSGIDGLQMQGALPNSNCEESVQGEIKPGSMVTVFLAKGSRDVGGSGTVFWRDGDRIYVFGHQFFGTGQISYPFAHVSVADTLQTPFQANKVVGCRLETEGEMQMDGMFEVAGVVGRQARLLPFQVELHIDNNSTVFSEEVAESPLASAIISQLPVMWAQDLLGNISQVSVAHQTRMAVTDQPEIFLEGLLPAQVVSYPFVGVFSEIGSVLAKLRDSGFVYNLEGIKTHIDFVRGVSVWTAKRSFLSQLQAKPEDVVYINIFLEEWSSGAVRQVSIPVKAPDDFADRVTPRTLPQLSVVVQSADKFVSRSAPKEVVSLRDVIGVINESAARQQNVLYVQQVMPLTKSEREAAEKAAKSAVQPEWSWTDLDQGAMRRLPRGDNQDVVLSVTPELGHYVSFDRTFVVQVDLSDRSATADGEVAETKRDKRWFDYLKVWRLF